MSGIMRYPRHTKSRGHYWRQWEDREGQWALMKDTPWLTLSMWRIFYDSEMIFQISIEFWNICYQQIFYTDWSPQQLSCSQYHACWFPGDTSRQGISRHDIDPLYRTISWFSTTSTKGSKWEKWGFYQLVTSWLSMCRRQCGAWLKNDNIMYC